MIRNDNEMYFYLHGYIDCLVCDRNTSLKLVDILTKAEIPYQTFVTAAKLYLNIVNRADAEKTQINRHSIENKRKSGSNRAFLIGKTSCKLINDPYTTFISCCIIASKFYKDIAFNNESWGGLASIHTHKINECEREALDVLDYKISSAGDFKVQTDIENYLKFSGYESAFEINQRKKFMIRNVIRKLFCLG